MIISGALILASNNLIAVDSYDIIDLGDLGTSPSFVYGINNNDIAVGYSSGPLIDVTDDDGNVSTAFEFREHAFAYVNSEMTDLGAIVNPDGNVDLSIAFAINDNNRVAGYSFDRVEKVNSAGVPFEQDIEKAIYIDVGNDEIFSVPPIDSEDPQNMRALSINNNNIIVGVGAYNPPDDVDADGDEVNSFFDRGFVYDIETEVLTLIEPISDDVGLGSSVRDVNNDGIVTGWAHKSVDGIARTASFYTDPTDPSTAIEMTLFSDGNTLPWSINDNGKIVGRAANADNTHFLAYLYDINTQETISLGLLNDTTPFAEAFDINNHDQAVGNSLISRVPDRFHAFIYENGEMKDLNNMIDCKVDPSAEPVGNRDWSLHSARSINDAGVIVGNGILNGASKAFMLVPRAAGEQAVACQPTVIEDSSGSGSLPFWVISVLLAGSLITRRKG